MRILFIEPFYSGSHKTWLDRFARHSCHHIELMTMEGRFWKWRMYGSSVTMADRFMELFEDHPKPFDLILTTDMMDVPVFISLVRKQLTALGNPPVGIYFHENQFAYPWQTDCDDIKHKRDVHYGMTNYTSALTADFLLFNSKYNRDSFFKGIRDVLGKMPDYPHDTLGGLQAKSHILPIGIDAPVDTDVSVGIDVPFSTETTDRIGKPLILWNHRLEHDKNPVDFFKALQRLQADDIAFNLALIGEVNAKAQKAYSKWIEPLREHIIAEGFQGYDDYIALLRCSDILPVTSIHDFFGISVMEAIGYGCHPLLPKRLTYPDLYDMDSHPELFYKDNEELYAKLKHAVTHISDIRQRSYAHLTVRYRWTTLIHEYDALLSKLAAQLPRHTQLI